MTYRYEEWGRWQISRNGGGSPLWSRNGRELIYHNHETPKSLFRGNYVYADFTFPNLELNTWDISPDGKPFLMMKEAGFTAFAESSNQRRLNWLEELKQRVPLK